MARSTTTMTTGVAGSGKSYSRCARFLADEFLPEETGIHYSNFPVNIEALAKFRPKEDVIGRVKILPENVLKSWAEEKSGPWEYFHSETGEVRDIAGAHIALDEAHNYCGQRHNAAHRAKWAVFCGELRHRGASIEFLTQDPAKLAKEIELEAGTRILLSNIEQQRDPFFRILMADWYELRAGLFGLGYRATYIEDEQTKVVRSWKTSRERKWPADPEYYALYNSFNATHDGGKGAKPKRQYERLSKLGLVQWFAWRNAGQLASRAAIVAVWAWFFCGGGGTVIRSLDAAMRKAAMSSTGDVLTGPRAKGAAKRIEQGGGVSPPSDNVPEPTATVSGEEFNRLAGDLAQVIEEREQLQQALESLKREKGIIGAYYGNQLRGCVLKEGSLYVRGAWVNVGEKLDFGPWGEGPTVVSVDPRNRIVELDNGDRLRVLPSTDPGRFGPWNESAPSASPVVPVNEKPTKPKRPIGNLGTTADTVSGRGNGG